MIALAVALCAPLGAQQTGTVPTAPGKMSPKRITTPPAGARPGTAPKTGPDAASPERTAPAAIPPADAAKNDLAPSRLPDGQGDGIRPPAGGNVRIALASVPLSAVVLYISEFSGKPVLLPDRFPGDRTVDVVSKGGAYVPQAKAIEIMAAALRSAGYAMVEHADFIQIISEGAPAALVTDTFPASGIAAETLLTMVVEVKNADAKNVAQVLSGLRSRTGSVTAYSDSNKLIITEQGAPLRAMLELLKKLDVKWADNVTEQLKLANTSVDALTGVVANYVRNLTAGADPLVKQRLSTFSVYPYAPTNSFLLFGNTEDIRRVREFIQSLDVVADPSSRAYHTYFVLNRDVADMVSVLKNVFGAVKARAGKDVAGEPIPEVIPDPTNGSIILICGKDKYEEVLPLIRELDSARAQVQIEAALVEMSTERLMDLGMELASLDPPGSNARGFGGTTFGMSTLSTAGRTPIVPPDGGLTAGIFKDGALNIAALLRLSQSDSSVSFIAVPLITASDNKPAIVKTSELREYQKAIISPEGTTSEVTGGNFNEASITLEITPHINQEGTVRLEISQTTEQFLPSTESASGTELTNKTSRMAKTEVLVPEGRTIVIAGLTRTVQSKSVSKVPLLGDIPLLGFFFKRTTTTNEQRNLCVFITPTILRGADAIAAQADARRRAIEQASCDAAVPLLTGDMQTETSGK